MNSRLAVATHILGILTVEERERQRSVTSDELAARIGTNPVVVRRILLQLKEASLVESRRGAGGGTVLARDPRRINLRQVYEAVSRDAPEVLGRHASAYGTCEVAPLITEYLDEVCGAAEEAMLARLATVTIDEVSQQVLDRLRRRAALNNNK